MTDTGATAGRNTAYRRKEKSTLREYAEAIIIALLLAMFVRTFIVQAFKIPSGSMEDTLLVGDHILVSKFIYWLRDIERGDVIVFRYPQDEAQDYIKRVVGLPGDHVSYYNRRLSINGKPLKLDKNGFYHLQSAVHQSNLLRLIDYQARKRKELLLHQLIS